MRLAPVSVAAVALCVSCHRDAVRTTEDPDPISLNQGVRELTARIPQDLAREGPKAWLRHFRRSPSFFMASDGRLLFPDNSTADSFIADLATQIRALDLQWKDIRIDSLAPGLALIAAAFEEGITDTAGQTQRIEGYFTAVAERTDSGWQLRSAHWSLATGTGQH